jgi:DNA adenine methylase
MLGESWAYSRTRNQAEYFSRVKNNFNENYMKRLERTQIFCRDAIDVIKAMDSPDTFHFIDPPYINTDCAHYEGYTVDDFKALLNTISTIKGKFLLTTFPTEILATYSLNMGWRTIENEMHKSAGGLGAIKTEVFTMNFESDVKQLNIFENETATETEAV